MATVKENEPEKPMQRYIVLLVGLNIRSQNRITLKEQQLALTSIRNDVELLHIEGDKGSYLVASRQPADEVIALVLSALAGRNKDLKIPGAALISPTVLSKALDSLANTLGTRYGSDFIPHNHGIKIGDDTWRAGLAIPVFPCQIPSGRAIFHQLKNAIVFGWAHGSVLVAKREGKNVHWGTTVTGPASSQMRLHDGVSAKFTSRSANVLRDLVG
jgi:hypothetical protein